MCRSVADIDSIRVLIELALVPWPKKFCLSRQVGPLPTWLNSNLYYKSHCRLAKARSRYSTPGERTKIAARMWSLCFRPTAFSKEKSDA